MLVLPNSQNSDIGNKRKNHMLQKANILNVLIKLVKLEHASKQKKIKLLPTFSSWDCFWTAQNPSSSEFF